MHVAAGKPEALPQKDKKQEPSQKLRFAEALPGEKFAHEEGECFTMSGRRLETSYGRPERSTGLHSGKWAATIRFNCAPSATVFP